jgi:hypothetical protein
MTNLVSNVLSNVLSNDTFGLRPLSGTWRTFPGARLTNGRGLEDVIAGVASVRVASVRMASVRMASVRMASVRMASVRMAALQINTARMDIA